MATATLYGHEAEEVLGAAPMGRKPDGHYEVVDGQIVEEPPLGAREGCIATTISFLLNQFVREKRLGRVANEVLFTLRAEPRLRRSPDVAFVSAERWPMTKIVLSSAAWEVIPDLAVEVISPTDLASEVQTKIAEYFRAGVRVVWVVYAQQSEVYVYESPREIRAFGRDETVDGGTVLPGFWMPLAEVFETETDEPSAASA